MKPDELILLQSKEDLKGRNILTQAWLCSHTKETQMSHSSSHISYGKEEKAMSRKISPLSADDWISRIRRFTR